MQSLTEFFSLDGQRIAFNADAKIIKTTINEIFHKAGHILGWKVKTAGIGFNKKIIEKVLRHNCTLIVYVEESDRDYFLTCDNLRSFLLHNNHEYRTPKGVWVDVIPYNLFTHKMVHLA